MTQTSVAQTSVSAKTEKFVALLREFSRDAIACGQYLARSPKNSIAALLLFFPLAVFGDFMQLSCTASLVAVIMILSATPYLLGLLMTTIYRRIPLSRAGTAVFKAAFVFFFLALGFLMLTAGTAIVACLDALINDNDPQIPCNSVHMPSR